MIDALIVGAGEYVTGLAPEHVATSDKSLGVVALTLFDLRQRGKVGKIAVAARNAGRFTRIHEHFRTNLQGVYRDLDVTFEAYPKKGPGNAKAYREALKAMLPGSAVFIFTPDDTHFGIAKDALEAGMHVLVAKPLVKTLAEHDTLAELSAASSKLLMLEVHKRFDPIYADAVDRIRALGDFSFMHSYMSQPKSQLGTFRAWAGISSDISYYLNSHHVDLLCWALEKTARPLSVTALASSGVADTLLDRPVEDAITLNVQWRNLATGGLGVSVHTAAWIAPPSDVHSQQRFFYMGHKGEINVDQAHRGYTLSTDASGFQSANPLFMKYTPREGRFAGQTGYGYRSLEAFVDAAASLNGDETTLEQLNETVPTIANTRAVTAILEAGRKSLDQNRTINLSNPAVDG